MLFEVVMYGACTYQCTNGDSDGTTRLRMKKFTLDRMIKNATK